MDPTEAELGQIGVLQDAFDWAGVTGELGQMLHGGLQRIREVPLIGRLTTTMPMLYRASLDPWKRRE